MRHCLSSDRDTTGLGWYRSWTSATYSIDETSSGGPLVYRRFSGWTGSFSSDQASGSTVIKSPETITAQWGTDGSLLFAAIGVGLAVEAVIGLFVFRLKKKGCGTQGRGAMNPMHGTRLNVELSTFELIPI